MIGWVTFAYFPIAHNVWAGGWLYAHFPNLDYAGGTVVHINAGVAGLVLALVIGRRVGFMKDPMRPHNLTLTMIGAGLLWFGWYGFNVGSIVFTSDSLKSASKFSDAVLLRDRRDVHEHDAGDDGSDARAGCSWSACSTGRRPRWAPPRAWWPAWWRSRRRVARSTPSVPWSSACSPVASVPWPWD